ncbi:MAG: hypothetical protein KJ907_04385, partial [Actinobacteria bacterium]|nr:hypothetical protein [Actinomycetota bacterium]
GDTSGTCSCVSRFLSLAFHVSLENAEADLSACYQTIIITYYGCIVNPKRSEETARIPHLKEGVLGGADDKEKIVPRCRFENAAVIGWAKNVVPGPLGIREAFR